MQYIEDCHKIIILAQFSIQSDSAWRNFHKQFRAYGSAFVIVMLSIAYITSRPKLIASKVPLENMNCIFTYQARFLKVVSYMKISSFGS